MTSTTNANNGGGGVVGFQPITKEEYFVNSYTFQATLSGTEKHYINVQYYDYDDDSFLFWFTGTVNKIPYDGPVMGISGSYSTILTQPIMTLGYYMTTVSLVILSIAAENTSSTTSVNLQGTLYVNYNESDL